MKLVSFLEVQNIETTCVQKFKERVILIYGPQFEISESVKVLTNKKIFCNEIEHNSIYSNPQK